jgi:hypothetical protein
MVTSTTNHATHKRPLTHVGQDGRGGPQPTGTLGSFQGSGCVWASSVACEFSSFMLIIDSLRSAPAAEIASRSCGYGTMIVTGTATSDSAAMLVLILTTVSCTPRGVPGAATTRTYFTERPSRGPSVVTSAVA